MTISKMTGASLIDPYLFSIMPTNRSSAQDIMKRLFDIIFSISSLIFFAPLFIMISVLIKLTSEGTIFYMCPRIGKHGKIIQCLKFRTMYKDADEKLSNLLNSDPKLKEEYEIFHKLKNDPRITKIGKWLRKSSLDELPQFYNVLIGTLSVVGPRPYAPDEIVKIVKADSLKIFAIRPGVTGLWQTSGRNLIQFERRIQLDKDYLEKQSLLFDLKLILKTIPMMIFPKGAF